MLRSELLEIIAGGESSYLEFKLDVLRPEQLAIELVAFANHRGGRVLLGVEDDGTIAGTQRDRLEEWVMDTVVSRYIHPWIIPSYQEVAFEDGRRVAVLTVAEGPSKPYVVRHNDREDIYVRVGTTSRRASREQQAALFAAGGLVHTEVMPVSGSTFSDLSLPRLENYFRHVLREPQLPEDEAAWQARLVGLGLMTEQEALPVTCSIAGVLLFASAPRRLFRQAGLRWMAFRGAERSYDALEDTTLDGPLVGRWEGVPRQSALIEPGLLEVAVDRFRPFISEELSDLGSDLLRERVWYYPQEVVREALVNAFAHRDWTRPGEVEVAVYEDRLEIISPGGLQNRMTVEKMFAGQRSPRNTLLVEILRDYGYVDARGMGVRRKIVPLTREASGADPRFDATDDFLRIVLPRGRAPAPPSDPVV